MLPSLPVLCLLYQFSEGLCYSFDNSASILRSLLTPLGGALKQGGVSSLCWSPPIAIKGDHFPNVCQFLNKDGADKLVMLTLGLCKISCGLNYVNEVFNTFFFPEK